jgi:hypothetical protein
MILNNVSFCRYLADTDFSWCQENWDVSKIVRAIKGESFKGYTSLRIGGALQRLDSEHRQVATDWFVDRVGQTSLARDEYILCPIPDSQCTPSSSHTPRTLVLARELRKRFPQLKVWPNLKFNKPMQRKFGTKKCYIKTWSAQRASHRVISSYWMTFVQPEPTRVLRNVD